jgi:predicted metal-dependent phosphoesterase TrpH
MIQTERRGRADLHIHTRASDGTATAQQVLDHVARRGRLDVIAITDHDVLDASLWACSQRERYPFEIVSGVEVTSAEGHVLALWVTQPIPRRLSLAETVTAIHESGGMAILAHPFEPTIAPMACIRHFQKPSVLIKIGIDAIETVNAGAFTPGHNWLARRVFESQEIAVVGNSDAHMPSSIGTGFTCFRGQTAADLRAALVRRDTVAEGTTWPLTVYLRYSINLIRQKRTESLAAKSPSRRLTHP